ncbi:MAG: uroporphyrinogen decarboxylase [Armatimonadetes bacterium]|nr:uroporphyrinogen decarboxylase [Armatimonadota bacterium]
MRQALAHRETDLIPYHIELTGGAHAQLIAYVGDLDYLQGIGNHIVYGSYDLFCQEVPPGSGVWRDGFGVTWDRSRGATDFGVVAGRVLPEPSLTGFRISPLDEKRLRARLEAALAGMADECPVADVGWGLFEWAWTLRGMEDLLMDMVADPAFVEALFDRIAAHQRQVLDIALDYPFDLILFGDDWDQQRGNIAALLPELIDIGLEVYQTFQPEVYDIGAVKRAYGQDLAFWGGLSTQRVLPFGTPEAVRRSVIETMRLLGAGGGYIAGPAHAVPPGVPPENLVALVQACQDQTG